ncbi:MAG TPA: alanine racemase [Candidatus Saccharimonadia bacterium]|nr:alanine racemase [Candidatus Saccharimonadia bacterium]
MRIEALQTPCLVLDSTRMTRNLARLDARLRALGVAARPHLKTCKSIEIARLMMRDPGGPACVSTLEEAERFATAGVRDILYAVGITPNKLARVIALRRSGVDLSVILDSPEQAASVARASRESGERIPALIEIDADGHRAGIAPGAACLVETGRALHEDGAELRGVVTHAGGSYDRPGEDTIAAAAEQERAAVVAAARTLRVAGLPCASVSVGSTPTAHFARDLTGVTEVRAGVYVFHDLVMAGLGVAAIDDIAIGVLASVIGHQREKGWILVDAGWMALSRDRGTATQAIDQGYGLVCDVAGRPYGDLVVRATNQEHGMLALRDGSCEALPDLPVGALVRILPNHACATAAQHAGYHVVGEDGATITAWWPRFGGW